MSAAPDGAFEDSRIARARRRRNGFALHLAGYFLLMAILVPLNLFLIAPATLIAV